MRLFFLRLILIAPFFAGFACSNRQFSGTISPVTASHQSTIYVDKDASGSMDKSYKIPPGQLDLRVDSVAVATREESAKLVPPLSIYFAFDRSGSMEDQLDSVKASIQDFSDSLESKGFSAKFGAVAFQDLVTHKIELSELNDFKTFINTVNLPNFDDPSDPDTQNSDVQEGGLGALLLAAQHLSEEVTDEGNEPVIIYVSDAVAHKSGPSGSPTRDCSTSEFENFLASGFGKRVKLFYSVATGPTYVDVLQSPSCNFSTVDEQYDVMMDAIKASSPGEYRGVKLSWPFNQDVLSQELPKLLKDNLISEASTCRLTDIALADGNKVLKTWSEFDFDVEEDGTVLLNAALLGADLEKARDKPLSLTMTRCCDKDKGKECKAPLQQSVDFMIDP